MGKKRDVETGCTGCTATQQQRNQGRNVVTTINATDTTVAGLDISPFSGHITGAFTGL